MSIIKENIKLSLTYKIKFLKLDKYYWQKQTQKMVVFDYVVVRVTIGFIRIHCFLQIYKKYLE